MIMMQSGKMVADTRDPSGVTQQPKLPKVRRFRSSDLKACLIVVACLLTTAFGEPGNNCNSETQFLVKQENGLTLCENCDSCPPGQTLSIECGKQILPSTMVICVPCKLGMSFSSKHGTSVCTPCSSCAKDQVVLQNCTLTQDIKCDKGCYGNDRYYDDDKGDCFPCTKCCNDELDVVENECKEKLGTRSNMICSFHSSVNRCDRSTAIPQEPTTTTDQSSNITDDYTTPSQGSKQEHTIPPTAQSSHQFTQTKATKQHDFLTPISVSVALILALLIIIVAVFLYIRKARQKANYLWCCNCDTETGIPDSGNRHKPTKGNLDTVEKGLEMSDKVNHHILSTESMEPLLAEGNEKELAMHMACSCQQDMFEKGQEKTNEINNGVLPSESREPLLGEVTQEEMSRSYQQESKLLSSLLDDEPYLQAISERLGTTLAGAGNYRAVAQYYGLDHYKISAVLEKNDRGATTALIESLAATRTQLTVQEFAAVVRQKAKREDVAELLEAYDSGKELRDV